jgi:hypothetical protein
MEGRARLPLIQDPGRAIGKQLRASMMTRDALRLLPTSQTMKATGPLQAPQRFVLSGVGYPNSNESMAEGSRINDAPRLAASTRGASAGV